MEHRAFHRRWPGEENTRAVGQRPEAAPPGAVQEAEAQAMLRSRDLGIAQSNVLTPPTKEGRGGKM